MFGFSKKSKRNKKDDKGVRSPISSIILDKELNVAFWEDFIEVDPLTEDIVGRKAASLFNLVKSNIPVPPFFVVNASVYKQFVYNAFNGRLHEYAKENRFPDPIDVQRLFKRIRIPHEIEEEILRMYIRLSGFNDVWVSVRSSVVYPEDPSINFSGIFDTVLNVRGIDNVFDAVKSVYASIFKDSVVDYAREKNVDLSKLRMSVVVQKKVQAEVSGVTFTVDPVTLSNDKMGIEAVFGLGDVIASGDITPDQYILNKKDL